MAACAFIESGVCFVMTGLALVRMAGHNKRHVLRTISRQLSAFVMDVFFFHNALPKGQIYFLSLFK